MYNLDIANLDNFYVGEQGWLVHNGGPCPSGLPGYISGLRPYAKQINKKMPQLEKTGTFNDALDDFYMLANEWKIDPSDIVTARNGKVLYMKINEIETIIVRLESSAQRGNLPVIEHQVNGLPILKITYEP